MLGEVTPVSEGKIRRKGGGRKTIDVHQPEIKEEIENIISPYTRGDPMNPLKWCSKSLRKIALTLKEKGYSISHVSIEKYLLDNDYSLQSNRKTDEGSSEEVRARKDINIYQKGIKVSDEEMEKINLIRDDFRGKWNYVISK